MWLAITMGLCSLAKCSERGSSVSNGRRQPSMCLWATTPLETPPFTVCICSVKTELQFRRIWLRDEGLKVRGVQPSWGSGVKTSFSFVLVKPAWGLVLDHCWSENMKISLQRMYGHNGHSIVLWFVLLSPGNAARQYCKKFEATIWFFVWTLFSLNWF